MTDNPKKEQKEKSFSWKPWVITAIVVIAALFLYTQFQEGSTDQPMQQNMGEVAATVNGEPIYQSELDTEYENLPDEIKEAYTKDMLLNSTIVEYLIVQDAEAQGMTVSEEEVATALAEASAALGVSQDDFFAELQSRGVNEGEAREKLRKRMLVAKVYEQLLQEQPAVADEDLQTYYAENPELFTLETPLVRVSHILVETEEEANSILTTLKAAENLPQTFAQSAAEYSLDTGSALAGGDLNFASEGMFVPEFEAVAFSLPIGQLSDPVKTEFGYHILVVTDKKEPGLVPYEEVVEGIRAEVQAQREQQAVESYMAGLMEEADIQLS